MDGLRVLGRKMESIANVEAILLKTPCLCKVFAIIFKHLYLLFYLLLLDFFVSVIYFFDYR